MIRGIGCSEGYGIGKAIVIGEQNIEFTPKNNCNPENELKRYKDAVDKFCLKAEKTAQRLKNSVGEKEAEIILGHILMVRDPYMNSQTETLISQGMCAEGAFSSVCDMFEDVFSSADDELTRQRTSDVKDIKRSVLLALLGKEETDITDVPKNTVIIVKELTPSMAAGINKTHVVGIVTESGGRTSHSAILARAMEIPAVLGAKGVIRNIKNGCAVIVDGSNGEVIENPTQSQIGEYTRKRIDFSEEKKSLAQFIGKETSTSDGIKVELFGNIGKPEEAAAVSECDGEGIGLFRTEFLFMDRTSPPGEDEQFEAYKKAALIMKNKPVIIRTLDVGGDKEIPYLGMKREENPFLGFRAIRYCLKNEELFKTQLRAIIRASAFGDIRILLPLVTNTDEVQKTKRLIKEITDDFDREKTEYNKNLKIGVMMETAAACMIADLLAKEVDFFSIGTNDLTGYIMSVDRGNPDVSYLYSAFEPAVIRSVKHIIECGKNAGITVGMCGEAAADKKLIPLLIAFGLDEFSVSPSYILRTRKEIAKWSRKDAVALYEKVMSLESAEEIQELLK